MTKKYAGYGLVLTEKSMYLWIQIVNALLTRLVQPKDDSSNKSVAKIHMVETATSLNYGVVKHVSDDIKLHRETK